MIAFAKQRPADLPGPPPMREQCLQTTRVLHSLEAHNKALAATTTAIYKLSEAVRRVTDAMNR